MRQKTIVAIYEDDPIDQFVYEQLLAGTPNTEFKIFRNLSDAFKVAHTDFDIVLIDVHFGWNYGGLEILKTLHEQRPPNFLAIAITPMLQNGDLERIMQGGFTLCLEKHTIFERLSTKRFDFLRAGHDQ